MRNNTNNQSQMALTSYVLAVIAILLLLNNSFITASFAFSQQQQQQQQIQQRFGGKIEPFQLKTIILNKKCNNLNYYFTIKRRTAQNSFLYSQNNHQESEEINSRNNNKRRQFITKGLSYIASSLIVTSTVNVNTVYAIENNELFKKNPLTNPLLEQIRIWEQAEADIIKYNGELERGDAGNKGQIDAYPRLLIPILQISNDIQQLYTMLVKEEKSSTSTSTSRTSTYTKALQIVNQYQYEKIQFKKIFNAYADNIYYSDPDRANVYLGGGTTPKSIQSLAYLLRNDILTNIENLQVELQYLIKNPLETNEDLLKYTIAAYDAMNEYITIIPPNELQTAKEIMKKAE